MSFKSFVVKTIIFSQKTGPLVHTGQKIFFGVWN
jgi:hypothetical protein